MSDLLTNEFLIEVAIKGVHDTCFEHCVNDRDCNHNEIAKLLKERFLNV